MNRMEDIFKPSSLTIKQLFGNTDALYQIPRYQRPYSWRNEQLEKLWDDLIEAEETEPNYFLGSVITAKPEDNSSYIDIVDGQQRLTTLTIMLCVFRDLYKDINSDILDKNPFAIDDKIVESSIKFNDRFERLRLRTHSNHQSDFEKYILNGNTTQCRKPYKKHLRIQEEPKYKFENTANFFTVKLRNLGKEKAGKLLNYIFNKVKIIRIDCQSVSFAIKLFQVLNDRGLDLSNSDLIKSYLIGKINKKYEKDIEVRKQKENQFMDDWKACETISTETESSLNDLFVMYEYYLLGANPKKSLYDELVRFLEDKDPNDAIAKFKEFCQHYKNDIYDNDDKTIYSFWYLRWGMYWRAILLTGLQDKYPEYEEFVKIFRRYYYLNWIAGNTLTKIKQTSFNLIKALKAHKPLAEIQVELEEQLEAGVISRAIDRLGGDIYYESWCKPLLFLIEYAQTDDSNFSYLWIGNRKIHVEHILPKAYKTEEWPSISEEDNISEWIHTGANLTLLSGTKNIKASNRAFEEKIKIYTGKGWYDDSNSGITAFRITQKIVDDYHAEVFNKDWNLNTMKARWNWFCEEVEQLFAIDLSSKKIK